MTPAIELIDVTKIYRRYGGRHFSTLKSALLQRSLLRDLKPSETFAALRGVSFRVPAGQTLGVIGRNGSGKSTALKLVAGITKPTSGTVKVQGRISALIELGAGFHPEISGRENVFINGIMLGLSRREIQLRFDEIVDFAEMAEFIDAPVKTYSSGMYMRLGFAVAIHVDPDVLLVDEVLAVGDEGFTHKCLDKFAEFKRRNKTVLLVTHSLGMVERFCDEALWLDAGTKRAEGDPTRVIGAYMTDVERQEEQFLKTTDAKHQRQVQAPDESVAAGPVDAGDAVSDMSRATEGRWGSGGVEIIDVTIQNDQRQSTHIFHTGEPLTLALKVRAYRPVEDFVFGVGIFNAEGVCVYGTNTDIEEHEPGRLDGDAEIRLEIEALDLVEGTYKLDVAVHKRDGAPYDYHRLLYTFRTKSRLKDVGIYRPRHRWEFLGAVTFKPKAYTGRAMPILTADEGARFVGELRDRGLKVVMTNGVFDLLHPGHVRYLCAARREGDALIVAVNSDRSVRANKGPSRPITPEAERAELLVALACIDAVVIFDEDTPAEIVRTLQPDVLVKGADWAADRIIGRDTVEARGGKVVRIPVEQGWSTSSIVAKIRAR